MRIPEKIHEIEKYLSEIESFMPEKFSEHEQDLKTRAACERYFEIITESMADLAKLILKNKNIKNPKRK